MVLEHSVRAKMNSKTILTLCLLLLICDNYLAKQSQSRSSATGQHDVTEGMATSYALSFRNIEKPNQSEWKTDTVSGYNSSVLIDLIRLSNSSESSPQRPQSKVLLPDNQLSSNPSTQTMNCSSVGSCFNSSIVELSVFQTGSVSYLPYASSNEDYEYFTLNKRGVSEGYNLLMTNDGSLKPYSSIHRISRYLRAISTTSKKSKSTSPGKNISISTGKSTTPNVQATTGKSTAKSDTTVVTSPKSGLSAGASSKHASVKSTGKKMSKDGKKNNATEKKKKNKGPQNSNLKRKGNKFASSFEKKNSSTVRKSCRTHSTYHHQYPITRSTIPPFLLHTKKSKSGKTLSHAKGSAKKRVKGKSKNYRPVSGKGCKPSPLHATRNKNFVFFRQANVSPGSEGASSVGTTQLTTESGGVSSVGTTQLATESEGVSSVGTTQLRTESADTTNESMNQGSSMLSTTATQISEDILSTTDATDGDTGTGTETTPSHSNQENTAPVNVNYHYHYHYYKQEETQIPSSTPPNLMVNILKEGETTSSLLVSTSSPPVSTSSPPVTTSSPPVTTSSPPVTTSSPPVTTSSPPVTTSSPPVTTSSPPVTTSSPPVTTSSPPVTTSSAPK